MKTIRKGSRIRIKRDWFGGGSAGKALGAPILLDQHWVPVLFDVDEDPCFFKLAGLETYTAASLRTEQSGKR